ncbi:hypothetical protein PYW07_003415 [Mythimna separata]|uniref:DNA helicase Pif1-like 2B domain-containing protein n=1 Tax=Mythimna separata TaxID=271217 RepID=A0AAD7YJN1_MYTSE|nr:hypothetical protein PYW07_003415 [Mythimna separata]
MPINDQAAAINECILWEIEGNDVVYTSINTVVEQDNATHYPVEFLNTLSANGLSVHIIQLKVSVPIVLLRNLPPPELCNETRLKVVSLHRHTIGAEILMVVASARQHLYHAFPPYLRTSRSSSSAYSSQDELLLTKATVRCLLPRHQS